MRTFVMLLFIMLYSPSYAQEKTIATELEPVYAIAPYYPIIAVHLRISDLVTVEVHVDESGAVDSIISFKGHKVLEYSSKEAAKAWIFNPGSQGGRKVKLTFEYKMMPKNTSPMVLATRFIPPFHVEIRAETTDREPLPEQGCFGPIDEIRYCPVFPEAFEFE